MQVKRYSVRIIVRQRGDTRKAPAVFEYAYRLEQSGRCHYANGRRIASTNLGYNGVR